MKILKLIRMGIFIVIFSPFIVACDSNSNNNSNSNNKCLEEDLIASIKYNIKENADRLVKQNFTEYRTGEFSNIDNTEILLDYISAPMETADGNILCNANMTIQYHGGSSFDDKVALDFAQLMKETSLNLVSRGSGLILFNPLTIKKIKALGVNKYNIDELEIFEGNKFTTHGSYIIRTTYTEDGTAQETYTSDYDTATKMLAVMVALDHLIQSSFVRAEVMKKNNYQLNPENNSSVPSANVELEEFNELLPTDAGLTTEKDIAEAKKSLNKVFSMIEKKGLMTDELVQNQKEWLEYREQECSVEYEGEVQQDYMCIYDETIFRAEELSKQFGLDQ